MGQYYLTVNLDRGEYLNPHAFGDGLKLLEFGLSGNATMAGLALLLSDGNGRGGGDCYQRLEVPKRKKPVIPKSMRIDSSFEHMGVLHCTLVPRIAGRWKGQRIIVAGDYANAKRFVPELKTWTAKQKRQLSQYFASDRNPDGALPKGGVNVYVWARACMRDISDSVIQGLRVDSYFDEQWRELYGDEPNAWTDKARKNYGKYLDKERAKHEAKATGGKPTLAEANMQLQPV